MLELCFGVSVRGALRVAQHCGGRGRAVFGVVMSRDDDAPISGKELRKVRKQAQQRQEALAREAIPLGGDPSDVLALSLGLDLGDIREPLGESRRALVKSWYGGDREEDLMADRDWQRNLDAAARPQGGQRSCPPCYFPVPMLEWGQTKKREECGMLELCFGVSVRGALRVAQHCGGRGRAVFGVVMSRDDDAPISGKELRKVRKQAQQRQEALAREAIPLGGDPSDVLALSLGLDLGDIREPLGESRRALVKSWYGGDREEDLMADRDWQRNLDAAARLAACGPGDRLESPCGEPCGWHSTAAAGDGRSSAWSCAGTMTLRSPGKRSGVRASRPSRGRRPWRGRLSPWEELRRTCWRCPWGWTWGTSGSPWGSPGGRW